jgi:hypothetical protein
MQETQGVACRHAISALKHAHRAALSDPGYDQRYCLEACTVICKLFHPVYHVPNFISGWGQLHLLDKPDIGSLIVDEDSLPPEGAQPRRPGQLETMRKRQKGDPLGKGANPRKASNKKQKLESANSVHEEVHQCPLSHLHKVCSLAHQTRDGAIQMWREATLDGSQPGNVVFIGAHAQHQVDINSPTCGNIHFHVLSQQARSRQRKLDFRNV